MSRGEYVRSLVSIASVLPSGFSLGPRMRSIDVMRQRLKRPRKPSAVNVRSLRPTWYNLLRPLSDIDWSGFTWKHPIDTLITGALEMFLSLLIKYHLKGIKYFLLSVILLRFIDYFIVLLSKNEYQKKDKKNKNVLQRN